MSTQIRAYGTFHNTSYVDFCIDDCPSCGVVFATTAEYQTYRREDGKIFYCPNGHSISFGASQAAKERIRADDLARQLEAARVSRQAVRDQAEASERSARAYKGHLTRLHNLIANGVCPVPKCHRSFTNIKAHIKKEHPQWADQHLKGVAE